MKKFAFLIVIVALVASLFVYLACEEGVPPEYVGTWVYENPGDERIVLTLTAGSWEFLLYNWDVDDGWGLDMGLRATFTASDDTMVLELTEICVPFFSPDWVGPGNSDFILVITLLEETTKGSFYNVTYSVSGNTLTVGIYLNSPDAPEVYVLTRQ
jgi:hypothetical protein